MLLDVHKNTVRSWLGSGLEPIDDRRPILIQGRKLSRFLRARREQRRHRCKDGRALLHALPRTQDSRGARGRVSANHSDIGKSERDLSRLRDAYVSLGLNAEAPKRCRRSASPSAAGTATYRRLPLPLRKL